MRPVRLELDGFASFRDRAVVDFTDADYVAFVGATGSGKSTLIDALTFALYGSAPRWESTSSIQYALAPTANRCTVRLIFDVGSSRYAVAREVRRSGASIGQRNTALERYVDPLATGDPAADEATEVLAGDPRAVRAAVVELLGLDFEDFCTCVVLPQGEFAAFLKASPAERQRILLKLLGARQYEAIGKAAGIRAAAAATRSELLSSQLDQLADATPQAEQLLRDRETELRELHRIVETLVDGIGDGLRQRTRSLAAEAAATSAVRTLRSVQTPPGIDSLQRELHDVLAAYEQARSAELEANRQCDAAERDLVDGPDRRRLEHTRALRAEATALRERQPASEEAAAKAAEAYRRARRQVEDLREHTFAARRADATARGHWSEADAAVDQLTARVDALRAVRMPDGLADLSIELEQVLAQQQADDARRRSGIQQAVEAAADLDRLPDQTAIELLHRSVEAYATSSAECLRLEHEARALEQQAESARDLQLRRTQQVQQARDARDAARTRAGAAALRPHLALGDACPVCAQSVQVLPPPLDTPVLSEADAAVTEAVRAAHEAGAAAEHAQVARAEALADLAVVRAALVEYDRTLVELLPSRPGGERRDVAADRIAAEGLLARRAAALRRVEEVHAEAEVAAQAAARTQRRRSALDRRLEDARSALHAARGRLAGENPPVLHAGAAGEEQAAADAETAPAELPAVESAPGIDVLSPLDAWRRLAQWAHDRSDLLTTTELAAARSARDDAADLRDAAAASFTAAERALSEATRAETIASRADERAGSEHERLVQRLGEIATQLLGEPSAADCERLLTDCDRLEAALQQARAAVRAAGVLRQQAELERDQAQREQQQLRAELAAVRDAVLAWSPPVIGGVDLAADWSALATWSLSTAADQQAIADRIARELAEGDRLLQQQLVRLSELLAAADQDATSDPTAQSGNDDSAVRPPAAPEAAASSGAGPFAPVLRDGRQLGAGSDGTKPVDLADPELADRVRKIPSAVELEQERARARTARIVERRRHADALRRDHDRANETRQVAGELQRLMSARRFPQWLADAALDTLVADASASLLRLSNQQFDLTHDKGEFFVIDHADADSRRSVRTLSGGETFQASLALALALSEQLATLAAGGRTTLDSIFLDEGFGTLDPDALDMVAATLENLREDRMVGVITHVPALAERVPVRFEVSRDSRTSRVERVGA